MIYRQNLICCGDTPL